MSNSYYPDGCTNREIDQEVNPLMGDDILELQEQLKYVQSILSEMIPCGCEYDKWKKEESEILEKIEALK